MSSCVTVLPQCLQLLRAGGFLCLGLPHLPRCLNCLTWEDCLGPGSQPQAVELERRHCIPCGSLVCVASSDSQGLAVYFSSKLSIRIVAMHTALVCCPVPHGKVGGILGPCGLQHSVHMHFCLSGPSQSCIPSDPP